MVANGREISAYRAGLRAALTSLRSVPRVRLGVAVQRGLDHHPRHPHRKSGSCRAAAPSLSRLPRCVRQHDEKCARLSWVLMEEWNTIEFQGMRQYVARSEKCTRKGSREAPSRARRGPIDRLRSGALGLRLSPWTAVDALLDRPVAAEVWPDRQVRHTAAWWVTKRIGNGQHPDHVGTRRARASWAVGRSRWAPGAVP
jgi:hypothetical protein